MSDRTEDDITEVSVPVTTPREARMFPLPEDAPAPEAMVTPTRRTVHNLARERRIIE